MLGRVPVRAELATARELGQAWEAPGQVRVWGWAKRPVRQRLVQIPVTYAPHRSYEPLFYSFPQTPLVETRDLIRFPFVSDIDLQ
jgi:hypothetical protein